MQKSQIRLAAITGSLPISSGSALTALPDLPDTRHVLDEMASSLRRVLDFEDSTSRFFEAPSTFKSMGLENVFVATNDLYVTGTTYTTSVTGSGGLELVATDNGAVVIDGDSGATFTEDGTEVIIIDGNADTRFVSYGGSADDPDVEFDGYVRFDSEVALSSSISFLGTSTRHDIAKITEGQLVLSGAGGRLYFVDSHVTSSNWSDKELGIPLAVSDSQWTSFHNLGFTSLLDALTSTGAQNKETSIVAAGGVSAQNATGLFSVDVSQVPAADRSKRIDVFVNGMLQLSGSPSEVVPPVGTPASADYQLHGAASTTDLMFSYDLDKDDQIAIIIR